MKSRLRGPGSNLVARAGEEKPPSGAGPPDQAPDPHSPHRLGLAAARRPRDPGDGHRSWNLEAAGNTFDHGAGRGLADGTVLLQQRCGKVKSLPLHRVVVCDDSADKDIGTARN